MIADSRGTCWTQSGECRLDPGRLLWVLTAVLWSDCAADESFSLQFD